MRHLDKEDSTKYTILKIAMIIRWTISLRLGLIIIKPREASLETTKTFLKCSNDQIQINSEANLQV